MGTGRERALRVGLTRPWALAAWYLASATAASVLAAHAQAGFTDLHVYRVGGDIVLHGGNLYAARYVTLPFTYPPFAAVLFAVAAGLPWALAAGALLVASVVALPLMCYAVLRLAPFPRLLGRTDAARLALGAAALAVWLEPVRSTLSYGQVDLVLGAAIVADLALPDSARWKGAAIGVAAGIKLTPAIFAVYLLVTRRYRAAAVAAATFAATVAIGFAVLPGGSAHYWNLTLVRPQRISPVQNDTNQSLLGAIARDTSRVPGHGWLVLLAAVAVAGLWLAARAYRQGNEAAAFGLCAVTGLLVSPISWTHHWVLAVPALLAAAVLAWRARRTGTPRAATAALAGLLAVAAFAWTGLARRVPGPPHTWLHLGWFWLAVSQAYVAAGLIVLAVAAWVLITRPGRGAVANQDLEGNEMSAAGLRARG